MTALQESAEQIGSTTVNIVIWSGKGGSGKTTVSQNVATWLVAAGCKVALVDTDGYANSSNFINMLSIPEGQRYTLSDVIQHGLPLLNAMYQVRKGLYIVPSDDKIDAASHYIVANELQEIMIERYNEVTTTLGPHTPRVPLWQSLSSFSPRHLSPLVPVEDTEIRERPSLLDYLIWDFPAEPGALGKAILRMPNVYIWAPVVLEPLPLQGFAQMKKQLEKLFRNYPERTPPIVGIIPYHVTHKKEETAQEFVKLYAAHPGVLQRAVHEDINVPQTQNFYPARAIYEVKRTSRAAREIFEIAMRIDGYTGSFDGSPACKHCTDIYSWLQQQMETIRGGA